MEYSGPGYSPPRDGAHTNESALGRRGYSRQEKRFESDLTFYTAPSTYRTPALSTFDNKNDEKTATTVS